MVAGLEVARVYSVGLANRFHALFLYSVGSGKSAQITDGTSDVRFPAFDRGGQYLYFTESTNYGTTTSGLDMSSDAFDVTRSVYGLALAADTPSPVAPQSEDEKVGARRQTRTSRRIPATSTPIRTSPMRRRNRMRQASRRKRKRPEKPKPVKIDLERLEDRAVALPLPPRDYTGLAAGKEGTLYLLWRSCAATAARR